ncbi:MAG: response regulator transcription factor [Sphingobium sp.]|nr:response regulator transcription factor [Sphingobium sp.]
MALAILIVEDDGELAENLSREMSGLGHQCRVAANGQQALAAIASETFDAVVMDRMLPGMNGITLIEQLRAAHVNMPILMLSALGRSSQKVEGLEAGADDYVVKPVDAAELHARLTALVRARGWSADEGDTIRAGDIIVSPTRHRAWRDGTALELASTEFKLLTELVRHNDTVLTRQMLLERVWNYDFEPATNIVDAYVGRLRKKLMAHGGSDPIATVRGVGYTLR